MDETASLLSFADRMLWVAALVGAPVLLASLAVGVVIGVIQAATSVSETTLTFVPKVVICAVVMVIFGASMMGLIEDFTTQIFAAIAALGQGGGQGVGA